MSPRPGTSYAPGHGPAYKSDITLIGIGQGPGVTADRPPGLTSGRPRDAPQAGAFLAPACDARPRERPDGCRPGGQLPARPDVPRWTVPRGCRTSACDPCRRSAGTGRS